jgi:Flp pilus assembly protein CpaB
VENISSSKLFTTRQGTVLLGVIAAVIAAIALLVYLNHYRDSVKSGQGIQVLVAKRLIQKGTSGDVIGAAGLYTVATLPRSQAKAGAFVDPSSLTGQVAQTDIYPNDQLTASDFGSASGSVQYQLRPDQRAVVVSLGSPQAVGGQITAGSHVDVWVTTSGQSANGANRPVAHLLFQDMYVLNAASSGGNVTLRANARQAGEVIYAAQNAQIWLVLRPTVGTNQRKNPTIGAANLVSGKGG